MKPRLLHFLLPLSLFALASCASPSVSQEEADMAKLLVKALSKSPEAYNGMVFTTSFSERYAISYESETEGRLARFNRDYAADGTLTAGYALQANDASFALSDLYQCGSAYFSLTQNETSKLSHQIKGNLGEERTLEEDYSYHHLVGIQFDDTNVKALANSNKTNRADNLDNKESLFAGKTDKEDLGMLTDQALQSLFSRLFYLDGWNNVSRFQNGITSYFQGLRLENNEQIASFIAENKVTFAKDNGEISASFLLKGSTLFPHASNKGIHGDKAISCTVTIDEESALLTHYEYDLKDIFTNVLENEKENKKNFESSVEAFQFSGGLAKKNFTEMSLNAQFEDYADNGHQFVEAFLERAIPEPAKS